MHQHLNTPNHKLNLAELKFMAQKILNNFVIFDKACSKILALKSGTKKKSALLDIQYVLKSIEGLGLEIEICGSWF